MEHRIGTTRLTLVQGDITTQAVDAIVNAANAELAGGGGVDGAIHRAGGPDIMSECRAIGGCPTGSAVMTTAGKLPARRVIHAVGPIWGEYKWEEADRLLAGAYRRCLELATEAGLTSIAFPSISTGVYGFPIERAAPLVLDTVAEYVLLQPFDEVRFVLFSRNDHAVYQREMTKLINGE